MTRLVRSIATWQQLRASHAFDAARLGFVPTLGGLHRGHTSLVARSLAENDVTILSVFLNPAQFDSDADLASYPANFDHDRQIAEELGVDYLFCPQADAIYPEGPDRYRVTESALSRQLCGAHRPGHFDGVLTVVLKLLQLVRPTHAYFGEKDYQQLSLVRGMVDAFFLPVEIVACPTVRDEDGLALSSRNARLSAQDRATASAFPRLLASPGSALDVQRALEAAGFEIDYIEDHGHRRFGAVRLGDVRLIDNLDRRARAPYEEAV